jgi:hypothetical protein
MEKRQIKMQDGRYLIFYVFADAPTSSTPSLRSYPPAQGVWKLKYLVGSETGAGLFINDTLAKEKAAELRGHISGVVWGD